MFPKDTRFLVIDDYNSTRKLVKNLLKELGFSNVDIAEDGKPALEQIQLAFEEKTPYGCILSDWNMPDMSGVDLLKTLRNDPKFKFLPFILVTAELDQTNIIEAAQSGVSDYITKPITIEKLKTQLAEVYKRHFPKK